MPLFLSSLRVRCILAVTLSLIVIFASYGYYTISERQKRAQEDLIATTEVMANLYVETLGVNLWRLDRPSVLHQLGALTKYPAYCGATITMPNGEVFAEHVVPHPKGETLQTRHKILFRTPKKVKDIGVLELCFSKQPFVAALKKEQITFSIASFALLTITLLSVIVSLRFVFTPLRQLNRILPDLSEHLAPITVPVLNKQNEIGEVTETLNSLITTIKDNQAEVVHAMNMAVAEKEKAQEANYAKSRFLATMSHELRTPLHGVIGMAELMMNTNMSDQQIKYATTISNSAEVLLTIINDILDFSKIESGDLQLDAISTDLYTHIKDMVSLMMVRAQENNIELILDFPPHLRHGFQVDPVRIKQIILNMLGNAIKFSADGYVAVRIREKQHENGAAILRFEIEDNGIGIPEDKQETIFDHFTQADISTTRKYGGTGLGLAICKKLVERMNGQIGVKSVLGKGSTFWFEIPAQHCALTEKQTRSQMPSMPLDKIKKQHVLLVDDFMPNLNVLRDYWKSWGINTVGVTSADKALKELERSHTEEKPYTLAIIDYTMPEINGEQLAKIIRADQRYKNLKLIMTTPAHKIKDAKHTKNMGFNACLFKPIYASELMDIVVKVLNENENHFIEYVHATSHKTAKETGQHDANKTPSKKILLAEDSIVNRMFAEEVLRDLGYDVDIAENGKIALEKNSLNSYDAILMDCMMPEMDGYKAAGSIREEEKKTKRRVPIIAMTANAMSNDRKKCLDAGMDDYIAKPARKETIKTILEKYLAI